MKISAPKRLQDSIKIKCYACEDRQASYVCRYQLDELMVQVCLCEKCMKIDTEHLLKDTIGIGKPHQLTDEQYLTM